MLAYMLGGVVIMVVIGWGRDINRMREMTSWR